MRAGKAVGVLLLGLAGAGGAGAWRLAARGGGAARGATPEVTAAVDPVPRAPRIRETLLGGLRQRLGLVRGSDLLRRVDFRCVTSRLHYQPGDLVDYRVTLEPAPYPDKQSAKSLEVSLCDAAGRALDTRVQPYGFAAG